MGLRQEKKAKQRRAILNTAAALFRKRGYKKIRVRDMVERLRISEVTFSNYFPTKDALMMAFALEMLEISVAAAKRELEHHACLEGQSPETRLFSTGRAPDRVNQTTMHMDYGRERHHRRKTIS